MRQTHVVKSTNMIAAPDVVTAVTSALRHYYGSKLNLILHYLSASRQTMQLDKSAKNTCQHYITNL